MLLEKVETINLPAALSNTSWIESITFFSLGVYPSFSAFVESDNNRSTPPIPRFAILEISISGPTGVKSILKSPVETILPSGVSTTTPNESGIEWVTLKKETTNLSILNFESESYSIIFALSKCLVSSRRFLISAAASLGA